MSMGGTAGRRGKGAEDKLEEQKVGAHHLTRLERMGHIFSEHDKLRMQKAFAIPDLDKVRGGDPVKNEKEMRWKGAELFVSTLEKGYSIREASHILNIHVSPLHFAMALLNSRQHDETQDPYIIAAMYGIDLGGSESYKNGARTHDDDVDEELLAKFSRAKESLEDFKKRIQTTLHAHIENVQKLHDELFSYKKYHFQVSSKGKGGPGKNVAGDVKVNQSHSETWASYQDEVISENSEYFLAKPWPRHVERQLEGVQHLASKVELLSKSRDELRRTVQGRKLGPFAAIGSSPGSPFPGSPVRSVGSPLAGSVERRQRALRRRSAEANLEKTQNKLTDAVLKLRSDAWALDFNALSSANRRRTQRPLSALYRGVDLSWILAYERYAQELLPKASFPMLHLPAGTAPSKGLMLHTGAVCPGKDEAWSKTRKGQSYLDLSKEDQEMLARSSIFIGVKDENQDSEGGRSDRSSVVRTPISTTSRSSTRVGSRRSSRAFSNAEMRKPITLNPSEPVKSQRVTSSHCFAHPFILSRENPGITGQEEGPSDPKPLLGEMIGMETELGSWIQTAADKLASIAGLSTTGDERGPGGWNPAGFASVPPASLIGVSSPAFSPIFVCCSTAGLPDILERTPKSRVCDLVLIQDGIARPFIRNHLERERFENLDHLFQFPISMENDVQKQACLDEKAHAAKMLKWLATRKILGSVHDEVKRLESLHSSMLSVNEHLLRALDAVPTCSVTKNTAEKNSPCRDFSDTMLVECMRQTVLEESPDYKIKLELQRTMIDEIETEIRGLRRLLHMNTSPAQALHSSTTKATLPQDISEVTIVVLNIERVSANGLLTYDTSYVHGRHAYAVRDLLHVVRVDCEEVSSTDELDARAWQKLIWDCCMWLLSAVHGGCTIRAIMTQYREQLEVLVAELSAIAQHAHSGGSRRAETPGNSLLDKGEIMDNLTQRAKQYHVGDYVPYSRLQAEAGARDLRWLNGAFLIAGTPAQQPLHMDLLGRLGVDLQVLELQGELQRLKCSRLHQCLAALPDRTKTTMAR